MSVDLPLSGPGRGELHLRDGDAEIRRSVLPGGIRVITESLPASRSATFSAWVSVGSRDELPAHAGSTHFLEHLLFKGTKHKNALQIAQSMDEIGGEFNAGTAKEYTNYYARVMDKDLPVAIDVIVDMVSAATLDSAEMEVERGVILEELAMIEDDPGEVAHEHLARKVFDNHALGLPIGGTPSAIQEISRQAVWEHYSQHYTAPNLIFAAAGGLDHDVVCDLIMSAWARSGQELATDRVANGRRNHDNVQIQVAGGQHYVSRDNEQATVALGTIGLPVWDERRYTLTVMNAILGGGMSSRLFQEVREKRGMAYSVYSFGSGFSDTGMYGMFAGCAPQNILEVSKLMRGQLEELAEHGATGEEIRQARGQITGNMVLGLESNSVRAARLGKAEVSLGYLQSVDDILEKISAVDSGQVQDMARTLANQPFAEVFVGPYNAPR